MEKIKIAFFGHRDIYITDDQREQLKTTVSHLIDSYAFAEFYFGGYGRFDHDAYDCMREFAAACRCKCKFCYVHPYSYPKYLLRHSPPDGMYDELVYLGSENIPPKIAIIDRNKKIVNICDMIIFAVTRTHGGAYQTLKYAERKHIAHINLATNFITRLL